MSYLCVIASLRVVLSESESVSESGDSRCLFTNEFLFRADDDLGKDRRLNTVEDPTTLTSNLRQDLGP